MLLQLVPKLPEGDRGYEVKWDGYRGIAVIQDGEARLWSRNERDLGKRFGVLLDALRSFPAQIAILDGEVVVLDDDGRPSFQALQYFSLKETGRLFYYVFDLLHLNGVDLMQRPLVERRVSLAELMADALPRLRFSSTLEGTPDVLVPILREKGLGGLWPRTFVQPTSRGRARR